MLTTRHEMYLMGLFLALMTALSALVGALAVSHYLAGHTLRAASSLILPAFLAYWAWTDYNGARTDGEIIRWYSMAWAGGLVLGLFASAIIRLIG